MPQTRASAKVSAPPTMARTTLRARPSALAAGIAPLKRRGGSDPLASPASILPSLFMKFLFFSTPFGVQISHRNAARCGCTPGYARGTFARVYKRHRCENVWRNECMLIDYRPLSYRRVALAAHVVDNYHIGCSRLLSALRRVTMKSRSGCSPGSPFHPRHGRRSAASRGPGLSGGAASPGSSPISRSGTKFTRSRSARPRNS